jgi:hypothetical protein
MKRTEASITALIAGAEQAPAEQSDPRRLTRSKEASEPIWVRPREATRIGGFGMTRCYELINDGKLKTAKVGGMRLISLESIKALGE